MEITFAFCVPTLEKGLKGILPLSLIPSESDRCSRCGKENEPERFRVTVYGRVICNRCDEKELQRKERARLQQDDQDYRDRVAESTAEARIAWEAKGGETREARQIRKIAEAE